MTEKIQIDETELTVRRVQTGILTILTSPNGKSIINHFANLDEAKCYAEDVFYPEKYAEKIAAEEVNTTTDEQVVEVRLEEDDMRQDAEIPAEPEAGDQAPVTE
jgi:hypothetical protein